LLIPHRRLRELVNISLVGIDQSSADGSPDAPIPWRGARYPAELRFLGLRASRCGSPVGTAARCGGGLAAL